MAIDNLAFLFPGQGSQIIGMGFKLANEYSLASYTYEEADTILGLSLSKIAWEGSETELNDTINTQPALLVHSVAVWRVLRELHPGILPAFVAGHSMGELSALVAAEACSFPDALRLVRIRGELMKCAGILSPGGMAAIMGLDIPQLEKICEKSSTPEEIVQVANDNCPGQVVISGANAALDRALVVAQETGAKRAIRLAVSIAAHSPLMAQAQDDFNAAVNSSGIKDPIVPLIGNITALPQSSAEAIREDLQGQLIHRVRWTESIQYMISHGVNTFLELGSSSVLTGLLKRIDREVNGVCISTPGDFDKLNGLIAV